MHDGAPPHILNEVVAWLNEHFNGRWFGNHGENHGAINWPPRSPDLSMLDFAVWGFVKGRVFREPLPHADMGLLRLARIQAQLDALEARVRAAFLEITPAMRDNVVAEYEHRLTHLLLVDGQYIEIDQIIH